jgi:DNA-binding LacI/PurR family transcriptional regulator
MKLKNVFSRPPVKVGMRLRPEREMIRRLGLGKKCVSLALKLLEDEKILSKRQGSGNYVRKIPARYPEGALPGKLLAATEVFPDSELEQEDTPRMASLPEQQRLKIQLWSGFHRPHRDNVNYGMYKKIKEQIELQGHDLVTREIVDDAWNPRPRSDMVQELKAEPADGYLVTSPLGSLFEQAYIDAFGTTPNEVIYISSWGYETELEPMICLDGHEAIIRAVRKFYDKGMRKIAYLGIDDLYHPGRIDRHAYDFAMDLAGSDYRMSEHVPVSKEAVRDAITRMLESDDIPEALVIGDNHLFADVAKVLDQKNIIPGKKLAIIAINSTEQKPCCPPNWTSIDFDRNLIGPMAVHELLKQLLIAGTEVRSIALLGKWHLRHSHLLQP